jgi:hypothetical protein
MQNLQPLITNPQLKADEEFFLGTVNNLELDVEEEFTGVRQEIDKLRKDHEKKVWYEWKGRNGMVPVEGITDYMRVCIVYRYLMISWSYYTLPGDCRHCEIFYKDIKQKYPKIWDMIAVHTWG